MLDQTDRDDIETLIDQHGLAAIVEAIAIICYEKADHIRTNWGNDAASVRAWQRAAHMLEATANKPAITEAPL